MKLSDSQLADLATRALWASESGYELALADAYIEALSEEVPVDPPAEVAPGSAAHVAALASKAKACRAAGGTRVSQKLGLVKLPPPPSKPAPPVLVVQDKPPVIETPPVSEAPLAPVVEEAATLAVVTEEVELALPVEPAIVEETVVEAPPTVQEPKKKADKKKGN